MLLHSQRIVGSTPCCSSFGQQVITHHPLYPNSWRPSFGRHNYLFIMKLLPPLVHFLLFLLMLFKFLVHFCSPCPSSFISFLEVHCFFPSHGSQECLSCCSSEFVLCSPIGVLQDSKGLGPSQGPYRVLILLQTEREVGGVLGDLEVTEGLL